MTDNIPDATEEFDRLAIPKNTEDEKVWCKIGSNGELELLDWDYVEQQAREYDAIDPMQPKSNAQIISKLCVLIRAQTIQRCQEVLGKFASHSQFANAIIINDILEEE